MKHADILELFKRAGFKFNQLTYNDEYVDFTVYLESGRYRWGFNLKYQSAEDQSVGFTPSHCAIQAYPTRFFTDIKDLDGHIKQILGY